MGSFSARLVSPDDPSPGDMANRSKDERQTVAAEVQESLAKAVALDSYHQVVANIQADYAARLELH